MNTTGHDANAAFTPKTGLFAALRGLLTSKGGGLSKISFSQAGQTFMALCALATLFALAIAGVAQAEAPKLISYGTFGAGVPLAVGVAVDQSSGDVYVAGLVNEASGLGPSEIDKFDASGKLLTPPSPFGEAFYSGTAVNPTNGDVYVVGESELFGSASVYSYDPNSGALLSSFSVPASRNFSGVFTAVQIATDSAGNVYVPQPRKEEPLSTGTFVPNDEVHEYSSTGAPLKTFTGGSGAGKLSEPTGVAVDSSGNLWVADAGNNRIEELSSTGAFVGEIKSEGVQAVALGAHGEVFAIVDNSADFCGSLEPPCSHLVEYGSAGVQLADIGASSFGAVEKQLPDMLAVNESSGRVYVTDGAKNLVWIFGPPSAPVVEKELDAEVSTSEAKLGGLISPGGIETSYRFEYDTREYREGEASHGQTTPFPEGNVGQGVTPRTVWASASGLAPGTTYHYRVIATNELGTVVGPDQTFTTEGNAEVVCPNEQLRGGFSASLPDCRAYELVTPPTKTSTQPDTNYFGAVGNAAREGNRMSYFATEVLPGSQSGSYSYLATRGASGWSSENVIPLQSYTSDRCTNIDSAMQAYSADLSKGVLFDGGGDNFNQPHSVTGGCGAEAVEVVSGEPLGYENLLLRDNTNGAYQLINTPPPGVTPANAHFDGASSDLSHVVFDEHAPLTPDAPGDVDDLYEWAGGGLRLVTVLPDGAPVAGSLAADWGADPRVISADGSHIFFGADGNLYLRLNGETTVQLDESRGGSGPGGGGSFQDASADGSQAYFTDDPSAGLTSDTVAGSGTNLYRYAAGELSDLTPAGHAEVEHVSGVSEDGSYVYFVARGSLAAGATQGQPNLYLYHGGTITFIATPNLGEVEREHARVSPNGAFLAFDSTKSLTGYDNTDANTGSLAPEIFLYSALSNQLVCASCNPSGEAPTAGATMENTSLILEAPHYLSDSGRLFFDTADALLPRDTDGQIDVYEYESGQLHLISAGTSSSESSLVDASESGNDVFILTRQKLVSRDTNEEALSIYDARVDGGFPEPASPPPCTTADSCRAPAAPQPSIFGAPSSSTFSGAGNLALPLAAVAVKPKAKALTCKRGFVKKKLKGKSRCVRKLTRKASKAAHAKRGH